MSGALTEAQLITEVTAALGNRVDLQITNQRIVNTLNLAQQRMSRFYSFPELRQDWQATGIVTGFPAVDKWLVLPVGVKVVHSFILQDGANSRKLIEKPWRMFDYNVPLPEFIAPEWPSFYTRFDLLAAMLYPIPLSAYAYFLRATMLPTPFASPLLVGYTGSQVSDFTDKDDIIIALASAYLLRTLGRHDIAVSWESEALLRLQEAKATAEDSPDMDFSPDDFTGTTQMAAGEYWAAPFIMAVED
jgi:hypothetical protein